jgi:hypothetical protein
MFLKPCAKSIRQKLQYSDDGIGQMQRGSRAPPQGHLRDCLGELEKFVFEENAAEW